jgi:hypothetical protein
MVELLMEGVYLSIHVLTIVCTMKGPRTVRKVTQNKENWAATKVSMEIFRLIGFINMSVWYHLTSQQA